MAVICENIARVRERMARAAELSGRDPSGITLVAVTKTVGLDRIYEAVASGVEDFGENYYQEAREKLDIIGARWHFIGHLQTNKAKHVAGRFSLVQSVDSEKLARELGRRALDSGVIQPVLVEVKLDESGAKTGVSPEAAIDLAGLAASVPGVRLDGLMGIAPFAAGRDSARPHFARLYSLFDRLPTENRRVLSMGMTADFESAIREGSTMVRIGSAIFGSRPLDDSRLA